MLEMFNKEVRLVVDKFIGQVCSDCTEEFIKVIGN